MLSHLKTNMIWGMSWDNIWGILSTMDNNPQCYKHLWWHFKGRNVFRFIFDTVSFFTKTSFPLITLSSSNRSARIVKLLNFQMLLFQCQCQDDTELSVCLVDLVVCLSGWYWTVCLDNLTCTDFLRQHQRQRRHTPRLQHSSDKVHIGVSIHCLCHNGHHRGVSVVEEHGEVWAALDGGDLGGAGAFSRGAIREPVCRIKGSYYFCMPRLYGFIEDICAPS